MKGRFPFRPDRSEALETFGDHLRYKRIKENLTQEQLSRALGVTESTIYNWESNLHHPPVSQCQKAIQFIGYDPFPKPNTLAERMISFRRLNGLRVKDAAAIASVDPCSWSSWEREEHTITTACRCKIDQLIGGESDH